MAPLDDVRRAAEEYRKAEKARDDARKALAKAIREAAKDRVPMTVIADAAGLERRTAKLIAGL